MIMKGAGAVNRLAAHIGAVLLALFVTLGLPTLAYIDLSTVFGGSDADAVTRASMELPEQPSGNFVILLNREKHPDSLNDWSDFFLEQPVGVIMEDVSCTIPEGDAGGLELARRYQARLAENQMELREENGLLVVSKAENGIFDVIVLSKEAAEAWNYSGVYARADALVLNVEGGA